MRRCTAVGLSVTMIFCLSGSRRASATALHSCRVKASSDPDSTLSANKSNLTRRKKSLFS
eukprot:m.55210 g.55210  ORF g.55210 m.55210 type:complete len:60 (+) comp6909_c0_seq1:1792-1971(+)